MRGNVKVIKALIAVRSGSERVKNKNIRAFADSSLLEIKIKQLSRISYLDGIVVNSNDPLMLECARNLYCETVKREQIFAEPTTSMSDVYINMAEHFSADYMAYCNVTNPLIEDSTIEKAITMFQELKKEHISLNTAHLIKEFMYKDGQAINYDPMSQPRSQDLPEIFALNFAVNVISRTDVIKYKNIICPNNLLLPISETEAIDIDSELDFTIAEFLYKRKIGEQLC